MADLTDDQLQALYELDLIDSTGRRIGTDGLKESGNLGQSTEEYLGWRRQQACPRCAGAVTECPECHGVSRPPLVGPFPAEPAPGSAEAVERAAGTIRKLTGVVVFLVALLLPGVVAAETLRGVPRVVDGDTVEVAGERVRLFGIDAPEIGQVCRRVSGTEWHCGWASAVGLEELIAGRPVRCEGIERDRYGRLVAQCFVGAPQVDLGGWLVARGLAVAYRKYSAAYAGQEGAARADRLGLWSGAFVAPWDWRKGVR